METAPNMAQSLQLAGKDLKTALTTAQWCNISMLTMNVKIEVILAKKLPTKENQMQILDLKTYLKQKSYYDYHL